MFLSSRFEAQEMDLPASYYGKIDQRNPVVAAFNRDINSFMALMRQATSSNQDSYARGVKTLVEIWRKYKHRLPVKFYQEHMLQIADFLFGLKLYKVALWQGYSPYLLQYTPVRISEITDVDHFMTSFFPEGFDTEQDVFSMKIRAMEGCVLCIFEEENKPKHLSQEGLLKLLQVLNFLRVMMQATQQKENLYHLIYKGSLHIYSICRYLMGKKYSAQAIEYLLWASISLEMSIPLMTVKYLPLIVTLYCAVCHCYYDNQLEVQAEEFARRALGKINGLVNLDEQREVPATRETQRAYKEASIKLGVMMFKRAAFEGRKKPKVIFKARVKSSLKDIAFGVWPRTPTERMLTELFDCNAAQFLGITEALWSSTSRPLQMKLPDDSELLEGIIELLSAGIFILTGAESIGDQKCENTCWFSSKLTPNSSLIDQATTGEDKIPILSAVRFIKLLLQYKQTEAFTEFSREILQILSGVEGPLFRKAERELILLNSFYTLLSSQRIVPKDEHVKKHKASISLTSEVFAMVDTLHKSVCGSAPEEQVDADLVLDCMVFLWGKVKALKEINQLFSKEFPKHLQYTHSYKECVLHLSLLCEVAFTCDMTRVDYLIIAEMIITLKLLLENTPERFKQTYQPAGCDPKQGEDKSSAIQLLQKVCEMAARGREAFGSETLLPPPDGSAASDSADLQNCSPDSPTTSACSPPSPDDKHGEYKINEKKDERVEANTEPDLEGSRNVCSTSTCLLAKDLYLELDIIFHKASVLLLHLDAVAEFELLEQTKKNKMAKALFFIQKALFIYNEDPSDSSKTAYLLQEAFTLIEKTATEERKVFMSTTPTLPAECKDKRVTEEVENPPPPPILRSRTDQSLTFIPASYSLEEQVCWYQLCGRAADCVNKKVHLGDCSLPGTGNMVQFISVACNYQVLAVPGECVLRAEGLEPNQKYVFAVAAYNSQGKLLGNAIGGSTRSLLASFHLPLLSTWGHLAQVAFQTGQHAIAKRICRELWSHYTCSECGSNSLQDRFATTGLHKKNLQCSSPHLCQSFLTSIFIETEINVQEKLLHCNSFSANGPFIWEREARLAECERMLVAVDLAVCLNDGSTAVQAAVACYSLLAPLIYHQVFCLPVVEVLKKCLVVFDNNSGLLKQKGTPSPSESFIHMIASITYYLSKGLRVLREHETAGVVLDRGRKLLQDVYSGTGDQGVSKGPTKMSVHLRALQEKKKLTSEELLITESEISKPLAAYDDPSLLYDLVSSKPLEDAYKDVMKLKYRLWFTEFIALLVQRAMEERYPNLVISWGQTIFHLISRRDDLMGLPVKGEEGNGTGRNAQSSKGTNQSLYKTTPDELRRRLRLKMPPSMVQKVKTVREFYALEVLVDVMTHVMHRFKKLLKMRGMCSDQLLWRLDLNFSMAQAHLAFFYEGLKKLHGGATEPRYSDFNPLYFSLAYSGVLVQRNSQQQEDVLGNSSCSSKGVAVQKGKNKKKGNSSFDYSCEGGGELSKKVEQQVDTQTQSNTLELESLNKVALHLRRAMVLAHRGRHWTTLQHVCRTTWDHNSAITVLVQRTTQLQALPPITADTLSSILTQLLVLATDLLMDMLNKLGLWSLYDSDLTEEEMESSLHFSAPLDDNVQVDLRWIRALVLYTLEQLHCSGKWESLAHFALLFNSYTRERYALLVLPLLVDAQRKLLDRISSCGGPAVPQPHHIKTYEATGNKVTCRSYADCQLLSGWKPQTGGKQKKVAMGNLSPRKTAELKDSEKRLSKSHVCVPLDVDDALRCFREAVEKKPHCLQVFQHSRSLLVLLLAHTQLYFGTQWGQDRRSASLVNFLPIADTPPTMQPPDLTEEDFSTPNSLYGLSISAVHISTVTAAYFAAIQYLQANNHDSLRVLALHEMGNLHFYNGNTRAAHISWRKAVDIALQSSGVVKKWDGMSFGSGSSQQTVKQAGVWGCLQAAVLTAKIARYILTSDIGQRTRCCLLSVHLFKCVLNCSMAHHHTDLHYASHSITDDLLPGTDLFSEPHRAHIDTTTTSLNFLCHWLFATGYYITVLPILALHLHFVGNLCRDVHHTVNGRILKMRVLTQLCLFTEAVNEAFQLTQGTGVLLPFVHSTTEDKQSLEGEQVVSQTEKEEPLKMFDSAKSLQDNTEALEDLVNYDIAPEVCMLYGPTLCVRFNLARAQLVLALANSVCGSPVPAPAQKELFADIQDCSVTSEQQEEDTENIEDSCQKPEKRKVLTLCAGEKQHSPEVIKFLLLEAVSSLLDSISQQLTPSQFCSEMEKLELTMELNLLSANLCLQQGHTVLSSQVAASSLELLQTSPIIVGKAEAGLKKHVDELTNSREDTKKYSVSNNLETDCPRTVEASERVGASLWLHCRLALVRSLMAHNPATDALLPDKNHNEDVIQVLKESIDECVQWRDHDTQALLMVEGAELEARRGRTEESMTMLQEAVNLLSGRTRIPPGSILTLARATLLLSDLRGVQSMILLRLTQKFLIDQLSAFGETVTLVDGKMCISSSGPSNIYLPYMHMLNQTTLQIGKFGSSLHSQEKLCSGTDNRSSSR